MKSLKKISLVIIAALSMSATTVVESKYVLSKNYTVTILGTSNLHSWNETVQTVLGDGSVTWNGDGSFNLDAIHLKMEVNSIKSDMGSIMNNNTYKALKADQYQDIVFKLIAASIEPGKDKHYNVLARGTLTVAGVTREVVLKMAGEVAHDGSITFVGSEQVKMSDYNVERPSILFGVIKAGDLMTLTYNLIFIR